MISAFAQHARARFPDLPPAVACFFAVRDLPYALDGGHDAAGLLEQGRGDCLAKSELLSLALRELGHPTRFVRWPYLLPDVVPEVALLPGRLDVHRAVQVRVGGTWVLADAAHHPGLRGSALRVCDWDGRRDSEPGFPPAGPLIAGQLAADQISAACEEITSWTRKCPPEVMARWRSAYIGWLRQHERQSCSARPRC
ncbi:MAG TPA: transglutaminase family protein [Streptosporangiaceae bacterium]|nr:transglutaminase family protein [Streptosporangiaceae bacterium]